MIVYAIKHLPSGKFMPQQMNRSAGRGWTYWEPGSEDGHVTLPRLFKDHRVASMALTAWLTGRWHRSVGCDHTMDGPDYYDNVEVDAPKVERRRGDMEIVKMVLVAEVDNYLKPHTGRVHQKQKGEVMTKQNEGLTPEQIVAARVKENEEAHAQNKIRMLELVDHTIAFLTLNREAIGGLSLNVVADSGTAMYDPADNEATEGISAQYGVRQSLIDSMDKHLERIIEGDHGDSDVRVARVGMGTADAFDIGKLLSGLGGNRNGH